MRCNALLNTIFAAVTGGVVAGFVVISSRPRAADAGQPAAAAVKSAAVIDANELQKLVRDEVERQVRAQVSAAGGQGRVQPVRQLSLDGRARSMRSMIQTLRSQIQLYRLQHNDDFPTLPQMANGFEQLWQRTDLKGEPVAAGRSNGSNVYGPYMQSKPANPFTGRTKVVAAGAPTADAGWTYDATNGAIKGVLPRDVARQVDDVDLMNEVEVVGAK